MLDGEGVGVVETPVVEAPVAVEPQAPPVSDPAQTSAPVPEAEAQSDFPADVAALTTPTDPATPVTPEKPWVPRADGTDLQIPGAVLLPNGDVRIPASTVGQMHRYLANRDQVRTQITEMSRELKATKVLADPQNNEAVIRSNMVLQGMIEAHRKGTNPATGDLYLNEWVGGFFTNLPLYEAQAKAEAAERRLKAREDEIQPIQQERQWAVMEPGFRTSLEGTLAEELGKPGNEGIDRAALANALWEDRRDLFRPSTPEEKQDHGLDWTIDPKVFDRQLRSFRYFASKQKETQARQQKTDAAAQVLSNNLKPPPVVSTKGSPTPQATKTYNPESPEDWEKEFKQSLKSR